MCNTGYGGTCCNTPFSLALALTPAAPVFGSVVVGASRMQTVTITTPGNMTMGSVTLGGADSADFSVTGGTCAQGAAVAPGGSCTIIVTFTPAAPGSRGATLTAATTLPALGSLPTTFNSAMTDPVSTPLAATLSGTGVISADSIVIDPATPTTLYAGLNGAGIYKSTDSGANWTPATTQPANKLIKAVAVNRTDGARLYAAGYGGGVYKSVNSGADWSACANTGLTNLNLVSLVIDGTGKLYAGTEAGVFVSGDGCATWTAMNSGLP